MATASFVVFAPAAFASSAPHIPTTTDTDACAMCHRAHTAASDAWTEGSRYLNPLSNALLTVPALGVGDTALCFSCHGVGQLGSNTDIEAAFISRSGHSIAPSSSAYGPMFKQCSSCHDSHGSSRTVEGSTYPALLRAFDESGTPVFQGTEYCGTCHEDRPLDTFDGMAVWGATAHATEMTASPDGTRILCLNCHDAHGSDLAPSIRASLTTPSAPATAAVTGNDRTLCFGCHGDGLDTYSGETSYTASVHAGSSATITIPGEWPARDLAAAEASRTVGECQVCHNPMGRSDGSGGVLANMVDKPGRQLCDQCHRIGGAAEESAIASLAYPTSRNDTELVAVWSPSTETSTFGEVAAWTTEVTTSVPADLSGPRAFAPSGKTGDAAAGDLDGNGVDDIVVADPADDVLDVYRGDAVQGLRRSTLTIPGGSPAHLVVVADLVNELPGPVVPGPTQPEIAVISRETSAPYASRLYLYTYDAGALNTIDLDPGVGVALPVGNNVSSLAAGNVTGTATADLVVTAKGDDEFRILTEVTYGTLEQSGSAHATGNEPRGASIGDVWGDDAGNEIAICNAVSAVSIFNGAGTPLGSFATVGSGSADVAYDSLIADPLWGESPSGTSGDELVVALRTNPTTTAVEGTSSINVFRQAAGGTGLDTTPGWPLAYTTGDGYESSALAAGDVDLDGREELAVGNAGKWTRTATRQAPSVQVFDSTNGTIFSAVPETLWSSGVEQASGVEGADGLPAAPSVLVANVGPVGPSRHPGDAGTGSHVSTEDDAFSRHVTCADCHNVHETTATVQTLPALIYGALRGAWGTAITNTGIGTNITYVQKTGATREYEVCLKCHSANSGWTGDRDVAAEVNPLNPSMHAIQASSENASAPAGTFTTVPADTFVNSTSAWSKNSQLYCIDCHTNSDGTQAKGPHVSGDGGLLRKPYFGTLPSSPDLLCYTCHKYTVYFTGSTDADGSMSLFRDAPNSAEKRLHRLHVNDQGFSCRSCHTSHGSASEYHLQGSGHDYGHTASGGSCAPACHTAGASRAYTREAVSLPTTFTVPASAGYAGELSSIQTSDTDELTVTEANASTPGFEVHIGFTDVSSLPTSVMLWGWYDGNGQGHTVNVEVWDFSASTWVILGTMQPPAATEETLYTFTLSDPDYLWGGDVRVRIRHVEAGGSTEYLHLDAAWLNP